MCVCVCVCVCLIDCLFVCLFVGLVHRSSNNMPSIVEIICKAQWLMGRASDYRLRERGFESSAAVL